MQPESSAAQKGVFLKARPVPVISGTCSHNHCHAVDALKTCRFVIIIMIIYRDVIFS